ncbi:UDP-N-acetylmuramate dehydrogenase [Neisseria leonii]|uniref:UDP-N-acetylmuramate dehydrogenase n=1 Tax=Neisseria leonii TaxID=2995413 RepID=UPI00386209E5
MMDIRQDVDLRGYHTFGLPARAKWFYALKDVRHLPDLADCPQFDPQSVLWLGGGSNVLFDGDYPALVVRLENKGVQEVGRENGRVWLDVQAGEVWHDFVRLTLDRGLSGLENLSLIPGTVGAAPVQNIGAYGVEVKDRIDSVYCYDWEARAFVRLSNEDCRFAYRESLFKQAGKGRYVIVSVRFVLNESFRPNVQYGDLAQVLAESCGGRSPTAKDVSDAVCRIRMRKLPDPAVLGNAGSFFKNPVVAAEQAGRLLAAYPAMPHYPQADGAVKLAAGWLIDRCGLKGFAVGGAAVHDRQALVLVNRGGATAADVRALAAEICRRVARQFDVVLYPEPVWLPVHG